MKHLEFKVTSLIVAIATSLLLVGCMTPQPSSPRVENSMTCRMGNPYFAQFMKDPSGIILSREIQVRSAIVFGDGLRNEMLQNVAVAADKLKDDDLRKRLLDSINGQLVQTGRAEIRAGARAISIAQKIKVEELVGTKTENGFKIKMLTPDVLMFLDAAQQATNKGVPIGTTTFVLYHGRMAIYLLSGEPTRFEPAE